MVNVRGGVSVPYIVLFYIYKTEQIPPFFFLFWQSLHEISFLLPHFKKSSFSPSFTLSHILYFISAHLCISRLSFLLLSSSPSYSLNSLLFGSSSHFRYAGNFIYIITYNHVVIVQPVDLLKIVFFMLLLLQELTKTHSCTCWHFLDKLEAGCCPCSTYRRNGVLI